ncbi:MAG: hypothetical protein ABMA00_02110 [Gemmatimonas sp.]
MTSSQMASPPIDVTAWIGQYPFRDIPHPEPEVLVRVLEREGFGGAWVGHLPGAFHRDPVPSNRALYAALRPHRTTLQPTPIVRPDWPGWERQLLEASEQGAPAVRVYPAQWGLGPQHPALSELSDACAAVGIAIHVTLRFEDLRQRHGLDGAGDVQAATLRGMARRRRGKAGAVLVVAGAGREVVEETHWGLTPDEQAGVFYDFHWHWGPPEDHFGHLVRTVGPSRLAWSSWWPLRLTQQSRSLIELLPDDLRAVTGPSDFADGHSISTAALAAKRR